jgi:hypothetical protein
MSLTSLFENEADALRVNDDQITGIAALARRAKSLEKQIDDAEDIYSASITEARRAEAFQWLRDHGFDDIIKNTVSVRFGRGEDELCNRLLGMLGQQGFPVEQSEKVEPSTLKAWVKERVTRGEQFPMELFGAYIGKKASIKS